MTETDIPLKLLVREFTLDFAVWLLDVEPEAIRRVRPLNVELPADALRSDTVFRVTLTDGRVTVLHIEFQGRRSERPMPLRMLDYLSRLAQRESAALCSAVLYVGRGAGADDDGAHRIECADGTPTLLWRYRVVRLWEMRAEELLALERPALLTLVGQTRIDEPGQVLPQVVEAIQGTPDEEKRVRMLMSLTSLMQDEEVLKMAEQLMRSIDQDPILDTPFLRRIRAQGREEGRKEGREEGRKEGLTKGLSEAILDILVARLEPPVQVYRRVERRLEDITEEDELRALLEIAACTDDIAEFERALEAQLD
jgi:predicted transposase YdaD